MKLTNNTSYQPSFKELLSSPYELNETGRQVAQNLENALSYRPEIEELDKKGIDVVIYPFNDKFKNKAKISIIDSENRIFKHNGKEFVSTTNYIIGHNPDGTFKWASSDNYDEVMKYIKSVLNGTAKQTKKATTTLKNILTNFPIRKNWLDNLLK